MDKGDVLVVTQVHSKGRWRIGDIMTIGKDNVLIPERKIPGCHPEKALYKLELLTGTIDTVISNIITSLKER